MQYSVVANKLNIRSLPGWQGKKIGILSRGMVVSSLSQYSEWHEIRYGNGSGFIHADYVQPAAHDLIKRGQITASKLNVRDYPGMAGNIVGSLARDSLVEVVTEMGKWLQILFNDATGYISRDYVVLRAAKKINQGRVKASILNVRLKPSINSTIAGTLRRDAAIPLKSRVGEWYETIFLGAPAFVHSKFIENIVAPPTNPAEEEQSRILKPARKLQAGTTNDEIKAADTWNKYGGILEELCGSYQLEPACVVAVLCVESNGQGFSRGNNDRMIIRFENHKMWKYWGREHPHIFQMHFRYGHPKVWRDHKWRPTNSHPWEKFHGRQVLEWQVLQFARELDDTAALKSISMGAPQIMGFNYARLGYDNVQDMFEAFSGGIGQQIHGLFKFFDEAMISALRSKDFVGFAGAYNGSGQKEKYGTWIENHYRAFNALMPA